jgi:hypothetical protein
MFTSEQYATTVCRGTEGFTPRKIATDINSGATPNCAPVTVIMPPAVEIAAGWTVSTSGS